jgi:hypothetical protein
MECLERGTVEGAEGSFVRAASGFAEGERPAAGAQRADDGLSPVKAGGTARPFAKTGA